MGEDAGRGWGGRRGGVGDNVSVLFGFGVGFGLVWRIWRVEEEIECCLLAAPEFFADPFFFSLLLRLFLH